MTCRWRTHQTKVGGQGVYVDVISGQPYPSLPGDVGLVKLPSLDLIGQPHNGNLALRPRHLLGPIAPKYLEFLQNAIDQKV
ncbi:MAG: hypothetical protein AAF216_04700 [Pseudomonadota bacterium]